MIIRKEIILASSDNEEININNFIVLERYTSKNKIDKYKIIDLLSDGFSGINNFLIEINVMVGEVDIIPDFPKEIKVNKVNNLNQISLFITLESNNKYNILPFSIKSLENSFYSLSFLPNLSNDIRHSKNIFITYGIPRLYSFSTEYLNDTLRQLIIIPSYNYGIKKTVNLKSLNCEINVYQSNEKGAMEKELIKYDSLYHQAPKEISTEMEFYLVNITKVDLSEYNNKFCYVYLSYFENMEDKSNSDYMDLLVLDNIPQQIMFNQNYKYVSFGYYLSKPENDIIIKYSSKHKVKYIAKIFYNFLY